MSPQSALPDDLTLLRAMARGDASACDRLYRRYSTPIFAYLLALVGERAAAEDLLQEVFLAAWRGAERFRGKAQVKTWLYRIAHHQAVSYLRRRKPLAGIPQTDLPDQAASPEESAHIAWQAGQVQAAIAKLSPKHRAVVELAFVHGLTMREIAEALSCSPGTVKSRMHYALRMLKSLLE